MGAMRKSRLSHYKQDRLLEHFVAGTDGPHGCVSIWGEPQDGDLLFPSPARDHRL